MTRRRTALALAAVAVLASVLCAAAVDDSSAQADASDRAEILGGDGSFGNPYIVKDRKGYNAVHSLFPSAFIGVELDGTTTSIGTYAFVGCTSLVSISIPSSVTSIEMRAFYGCTSLVSVSIPSSVTSISARTFYGCSSLASVFISDSVTSIGEYAFYRCTSLASIFIPSSVFYIGFAAFGGLEFLDSDGLAENSLRGHAYAGSGDGVLVRVTVSVGDVLNVDGAKYRVDSMESHEVSLIGCESAPETIAVPSSIICSGIEFSVVSVADKAFYGCTSLKSVDLGSVETVGLKAFANCSRLTELAVPATLKTVKGYAFYGCGITSLEIPGDDVVLEASAFSACKRMSSIVFSGHGAAIGQNAFYKNNVVSSVDLSTVASVGFKSFSYCYGMKTLTIPSNVPTIGEYAFYKCTGLKELVVEDGVRKIGRSAFSGCAALELVDLPGSLVYVGPNAFYGKSFADENGSLLDPVLKNLRGHTFGGSGRILSLLGPLADGQEFSANGLRYAVSSAEDRTVSVIGYEGDVSSVPSTVSYGGCDLSVVSIGDGALLRCQTLVSADLSNVRSLGFKSLGSCASLSEISFGEGLESIGGMPSTGCRSMTGTRSWRYPRTP